ncbi:MAG: DUF1275 domain-containing protein [Tissierellia bacterium]|nr:DUF1275 domain-containing protein [Tissierellia bacterium]
MEPANDKFFYKYIGELTFLAGTVNICAIVFLELTITHYTGTLSNAAIALANGEFTKFSETLSCVVTFFLGSIISGYINYERKSNLTKYDSILPILFGITMHITVNITVNSMILLSVISLGMGIQNGTYIKLKGILVRTTHMTGHLTDAGFCLGSLLHGNRDDAWKLMFYMSSILLFFFGGFTSFLLIRAINTKAIEVIALLYCIFGLNTGYHYLKEKQNIISLNVEIE